MMMLFTIFLLLLAVHLPLPATAAPNLRSNPEPRRPNSNIFSVTASLTQVDPAFLLNSSTSSTRAISSASPPAPQWNRTLCHGNLSSANIGSSAFRESKTGSAIASKNSSYYGEAWNKTLGNLTTTVNVTNCSQSLPQRTPDPKCNCPQLQTATIFVTVTATDYQYYPSSSNVGSQTLPSSLITSSTPNTALESSLEALPSPTTSSSQLSSVVLATASSSGFHSVEQASSTHSNSLQPALFSNYPLGPNFITESTILSMPTMSVPVLPTNSQSFYSTISEPGNTVPIGSVTNSSSSSRPCPTKIRTSPSLQSGLPTVISETPTTPSKDNLTSNTNIPEIMGGLTFSNPHPASSAPLQPASDSRQGSTISGETFSRGQESHPSNPRYSSNFPTTVATSGSSATTPSQQASLQSSIIQSYLGQTPSTQSPPQDTSASLTTMFVASFTIPSIPVVPPPSSMISASDSPPINSQSTVLPITSIMPPPPVIPSNITVPTPPATPPNSANPPYANISQALNMTTSSHSTSLPPSRTPPMIFPTQGPHSPPRVHNGSLHTVMCFPNTTSITHILANVCLAPMPNLLFLNSPTNAIPNGPVRFSAPQPSHVEVLSRP